MLVLALQKAIAYEMSRNVSYIESERMGIGINIAETCVREAKRRPLGDVLLFGRQTMLFSRETAVTLVRDFGFDVSADPTSLELDSDTKAAGSNNISDAAFFKLLGVEKIRSMDKSAYERADVIHDLNTPIPDSLAETTDFILDGSTLDNVWDPAMALRNMARLLRPGGRIVSINQGSNHNTPYTLCSPTWILDYFVINRFADCRVAMFVIGGDGSGGFNTFSLDIDRLDRHHPAGNFVSSLQMGLFFVAEKGERSTYNASPSQEFYRSDEEWKDYEALLAPFRKTSRSEDWGSSVTTCYLNDVPASFKFEDKILRFMQLQ